FMKVCTLQPTTSNMYKLVLIRTEENLNSLDIAIKLLETGELATLEVNKDAKIAFSKDESYIQSIISSSMLRQRKKIDIAEEAKYEMDQLLLNLDV
ncbi:hypothetical protein, partial [Aeromonas jandaei]